MVFGQKFTYELKCYIAKDSQVYARHKIEQTERHSLCTQVTTVIKPLTD